MSERWNRLNKSTKLAIYFSGVAIVAALISGFLFVFLRQRRNGRQEREAYNQLIEKQQQDAYAGQVELHDKGMGGLDRNAHGNQGAWGGNGTGYVGPSGSVSAGSVAAAGAGIQAGQHGPMSPNMMVHDEEMIPQRAEFDMKPHQPRFGGNDNGGSYMKM